MWKRQEREESSRVTVLFLGWHHTRDDEWGSRRSSRWLFITFLILYSSSSTNDYIQVDYECRWQCSWTLNTARQIFALNPNVDFSLIVKKNEIHVHFKAISMVPFSLAFYVDYFSKVPRSYFYNHHQAHTLSIIGFLAESDFLDDLDHIITYFDKTTKLRFRNAVKPQFVRFGATRDNEDCNIHYG